MGLLQREPDESGVPWQHILVTSAGWICLASLLLWILARIWPALFIPWWFNTDEVVFYYESIRQLRLDLSQTFFDIPGTPFVTITSVLTAMWWLGARLIGLTTTAGPSDFAFEHIQGVFTLMRMLTFGMYLTAGALAFDLFRRTAGVLTAIAAAILFVSLPIYVQYSYFARSESLGLVLCLGAIWIVLYSRWRGTPKAYALGGILAGVAMAARYHFALVGFPVIMAIYFLRDRPKLVAEGKTRGVEYKAAAALAALFIGGAVVTLLLKFKWIDPGWLTDTLLLTTSAAPAEYAGAKQLIAKLWLVLGTAAAAILLLHWHPRTRGYLWPAINPMTLALVLGFSAGFVLSGPEFLWRGTYQLKSIQFYSDWTDPKLASLSLLQSWWNVSAYYFTTAFPERLLRYVFIAGAGFILWQRRPVPLAFLLGAAVCFFAHPPTMRLWPHHVIPWLPFLCYVAAAPAGWLGGWLGSRFRYPVVAAVAVVLSATLLIALLAPRLKRADEYSAISRARTEQIAQMNQWLSRNVAADSYLLVSYFALNDDGFLEWIKGAGVSIPDFVKRHRNTRIWWLDRGAVDGHTGYLCMSRADITFFYDNFERKNPGSTYDPFKNSVFQQVATFGDGFYQLAVFKFDLSRAGGS